LTDGEHRGPVQQRFHRLVTAKLSEARQQIVDLTEFTAQLRRAAAQLAGRASDGPCGPDCACLDAGGTPDSGRNDAGNGPAALPIVCTLVPGAVHDRLAEWRAILDHATDRMHAEDGTGRGRVRRGHRRRGLARLVAAEQQCWALSQLCGHRHQRRRARDPSPDGGADIVDALLADAAGRASKLSNRSRQNDTPHRRYAAAYSSRR
jgi:hypothetical protein